MCAKIDETLPYRYYYYFQSKRKMLRKAKKLLNVSKNLIKLEILLIFLKMV